MRLAFEEEKELIRLKLEAEKEIAQLHRKNLILKHDYAMQEIRLKTANERLNMERRNALITGGKCR